MSTVSGATVIDRICQDRIVAIIRLPVYDRAVELALALAEGGVTVFEFTLTGRGALEAVASVRVALGTRVCVGIGSVLHKEQAQAVIGAGAEFVVTPVVRLPVIAACAQANVPIACGALTPTEMLSAYEAGAGLVKVFPAALGGPRYVRDVLAPLPFLKLLPTGGVSSANADDYLRAGAVAVGIGGNLVSPATVKTGDFEAVVAEARVCRAAVSQISQTFSSPVSDLQSN